MKNLLIALIFCYIKTISFAQAPAIEWQKCIGGPYNDRINNIICTENNSYFMAGTKNSNIIGSGSNLNGWIGKLSSIGSLQLDITIGSAGFEEIHDIQNTNDGGYILAGYSTNNGGDVSGNHGGQDFWIVKINNLGIIQWQKCLGGTNNESATSIKQTFDDGYIVVGTTNSINGDVTGMHGNDDIWVVKLTSNGTLEWQKCLGGTQWEAGSYIEQTMDEGYILTGFTTSNNGDVNGNHGNSDAWAIKLSATGGIEWKKCYGGIGTEYGTSIKSTIDGGYILLGTANINNSNVVGAHGGWDIWVVKLSATGGIQWTKCLGGTGNDSGSSIQIISEGGYILSGNSDSSNGDVSSNNGQYDIWVAKITNTGSIQWQKSLGGSGDDFATSIDVTLDGGYIIGGRTFSNNGDVNGNHGDFDAWVVKLAPQLNINTFDQSTINLYPNPAKNLLNIKIDEKIKSITIYDIMGKEIMVSNFDKNQIDISNLSKSVYFFNIKTENMVYTKKIIKE